MKSKNDRIFDYYSMDARSDRFEKVFDFVNTSIVANYGGGPLKFIPDDIKFIPDDN